MTEDKYKEARLRLCSLIKQTAKEKGITHQQIADFTGFRVNHISRMLAGRYAPSLDNFMKLAESVGYEVDIKFFK